jgi:hypothetical protein
VIHSVGARRISLQVNPASECHVPDIAHGPLKTLPSDTARRLYVASSMLHVSSPPPLMYCMMVLDGVVMAEKIRKHDF